MGTFGAEKAKNQGFGWQQDCGGGAALAKAPEEKWGNMGENGGKRGRIGVGVRFFVFYVEKWGKHGVKPPKKPLLSDRLGLGGGQRAPQGEEKWGKMGNNGGKWGKTGKIQFLQISPNFLHFYPSLRISPHFSPFSPIFPHFPPFFPIPPHFPPFFFALGTLWVRLWVHYPPPEPGTSEPC